LRFKHAVHGILQVPLGGCYRLIDIPMSNCINSGINKIFVLTQFNSTSLNRHLARTYFGNGIIFGDGFVEVWFHSWCIYFSDFSFWNRKFPANRIQDAICYPFSITQDLCVERKQSNLEISFFPVIYNHISHFLIYHGTKLEVTFGKSSCQWPDQEIANHPILADVW
jgi:hypothetical protein